MNLNYTLSRLLTVLTFALIGSFGILSAAPGCTDPDATNYDPLADEDDGSCLYLCDTDPADLLDVSTWTGFDDGQGLSYGSNTGMGLLDGANNAFGGYLWNVSTAGVATNEMCINMDFTVSGDASAFPKTLEFRLINDGTPNLTHFNMEVTGPGTYNLGGIVSTGTPGGSGFDPDGVTPALVVAIAHFTGTPLVGGVDVVFSNLCLSTDCGGGVIGCTDPEANNYNPDATTDDGSCLYDVTFNVNMNCFDGNDPDIEVDGDGTFTTPAVEGPFFGWCGSCVPMEDPDMDGIWSVTVELPGGPFEYKYAHDGFAGQEQLVDDMAGGADCAPITDFASFANRQIEIGAGTVTNDVYGSCGACDSGPVNATCDGAIAINEGIFTDQIVDGSGGGSNLCFGSLGDDAVWYEYTATLSGLATVSSSIDLDLPDTRLSVHTGTCADPTCLVSDDDGGEGFTSIVQFPVAEGEVFLIEWDDRWGTDEFDFEVSVEAVGDECPAPLAVICDNIDDYELGPMNGQGAHWSTWSGTLGGAEDAIVTDEQAFSNANSVLIAEGQTQDVILLLGNQTTGTWDISWMEYIPADATAYYNIQEDEVPAVAWNLDVFFNQDGLDPGNGVVTTTGDTFTYPQDAWFAVEMSIDLDADLISVTIDGNAVIVDGAYTGSIGSINFFSIDATNRYYLDDLVWDGDSGLEPDPCPQPDAIICDNIDFYDLGPMNGQGAHWSTWSGTLGGAEDAIVTNEQAFSNDQSVLIAEGQTQDVILLLGNQTTGSWDISWMEYIPADATAYYNIQEDEVPAVAWNLDVFFNQDGLDPGNGVVTTTGDTFTYPQDAWFAVEMSIDLDADLISVTIDGNAVIVDGAYTGSIGSINFFSIDATNRYYLDDVIFDGDSGFEPGSDCNNAIDISAGGMFSSAEVTGALEGFAGSCWTGTPLTANNWFSYTASADGTLTVTSVDIGGTDTEVAAATGDCGALTEIACDEDFTGAAPWESEITFQVTEGETYYIIWGNGWNGDPFDFEVILEDPVDECPSPAAIICDNIDDYDLGPMNGQGAWWSTWGGTLGGADDGIVTDEQAFSNSQSVLIAEGQTQDVILLLGNQTSGVWDVSWMEYIPADATAYYNIQEDEVPGVAWNLDVFFNQDGLDPGNGVITTTGDTFTYPEGEWFSVEMHLDLNNDVITVTIDGTVVSDEAPFTGSLGSINFFSIDATNRYYLDDVVFDGDAEVGLIEYTESAFTVYPNPTEYTLTISGDEQIDAVVLRDVLGSVVRQLNTPFSNQVTLDVADLSSGVYFVEVRVGDVVNVSRVIKR